MNPEYIILKRKAIKLRKKGLSYGDIAKQLKIVKSTASLWLRGIKLTNEQQKKLYSNQVIHLNTGPNSQKNRRLREVETIIRQAALEIKKPIDIESYRLFGAALYWAEGSKKSMFDMTNSDPYLILFWVKWLDKIFKIPPTELKPWLNIYPQQNELKIKKFWSELTGIPVKNFGKSYVKPLSKNYKKNNLYYGTIRVSVRKSTNYRYQVFAWTQAVLEDIAPEIVLLQRKWSKLRNVARPVNMK